MDQQAVNAMLTPYNPWWTHENHWRSELPGYQRPIVRQVLGDLSDIRQVISITGPRRVGKSTALKHIIQTLLDEQQVPEKQLLYFSFDDPEVAASEKLQHEIFDDLMDRVVKGGLTFYFFLDEIQRLPRWELFIKKYYDLKYPVRFVISGSASSPIFRSSQESLLGRIKDRHLLPFSFREFCQYRFRKHHAFSDILSDFSPLREALLEGDGQLAVQTVNHLSEELVEFESKIDQAVIAYCRDGGFPEVWDLTDPIRKIEYLMEQQVRKVLYEDLMMLTKYRKPENILRFFVYLLSHPGIEINIKKVSSESGVEQRIVADNLPRLEMTDLILRIQKFSSQPLRARQGNIKCYPIDLALRNAVLKNWQSPDDQMMGYYAENLVLRELISWQERIEVSYYREKNNEVDFIFTYGGNQYLPIEVKYRSQQKQSAMLRHFCKKYEPKLAMIITRDKKCEMNDYLNLPLRYFLLIA
ncbi:MAG: ATP-binding protein [Planctomycetota bacterium]|jgi:predicted AAA+ superfamily ATPase